jgi:hypothetical protein
MKATSYLKHWLQLCMIKISHPSSLLPSMVCKFPLLPRAVHWRKLSCGYFHRFNCRLTKVSWTGESHSESNICTTFMFTPTKPRHILGHLYRINSKQIRGSVKAPKKLQIKWVLEPPTPLLQLFLCSQISKLRFLYSFPACQAHPIGLSVRFITCARANPTQFSIHPLPPMSRYFIRI